MERVVIPVTIDEYKDLVRICEKYSLELEECINMALAQLIYIYKGS